MKELSFWGELSLLGIGLATHSGLAPCGSEPLPPYALTPILCLYLHARKPLPSSWHAPGHSLHSESGFCIDSTVKASCNMCSIDKQATSAAPDSFIHPPLGMPHLPLMDPTMRPPSFSSSSFQLLRCWVCLFCVLFCHHFMIMQFVFWLVSILPLSFFLPPPLLFLSVAEVNKWPFDMEDELQWKQHLTVNPSPSRPIHIPLLLSPSHIPMFVVFPHFGRSLYFFICSCD